MQIGEVWRNLEQFGVLRSILVHFGPIWRRLTQVGPSWINLVQSGVPLCNLVQFGALWRNLE